MNQLMVLKWIAEAIDKADALSKVGEAERKEESVAQKRATPPTEKKVVVLNNLDRTIQLVDGIVKNCGQNEQGEISKSRCPKNRRMVLSCAIAIRTVLMAG